MSRLLNYGHLWLAFLIVSQGIVPAATPESGADRLRKLLKMPTVSLESGFSLNSEEGFSLSQNNPSALKEISEIRKQLKGDSSDAEAYARLAELYAKASDSKKADECYQKAAILFRQQAATRPDDPRLLADFGRALWSAGKIKEADSVLRRAVQIDPGRAISWQTLGHFLEAEAKHALIQEAEGPRKKLGPEKLLLEVSRVKPRAEQVAQSRNFAAEASVCFDRAVAVSTNSSDAYLQRALHKSFDGYLQNVLAYVQGEKTDVTEVMKGMFNIDCLPDFQKAAQLSSQEYRTLAMSAFFEAFAMNIQSNPSQGTLGAWNQLPDRSQKSIRSALTRLENLGQEPDAHLAAGAMESLSILQGFVVGDRTGAERSARRAVALDPTRERSWDMLIGLLAKPETYEELRSICEQRVRQKETARNRILLAKAHERLNQLERAEENVQTAIKLDPNDFTANLAEAALLMKRRRDAGGLGSAARFLGKAEQILKKENKDSDPRYVQLTLTSSIYYALRGEMDKARELIRGVLESDKNNTDAREILSALSW
jgi:tetratricopeptide (TPR) repeat protein